MYFIFLLLAALAPSIAGAPPVQHRSSPDPLFSCDPALAALFTPAQPQLGRYDVCTTPRPLEDVAEAAWTREALGPLDAFGTGGSYDAHALARLYGGSRALVVRGWLHAGGRYEALTLISPYPDATLSRLLPGTLRIRLIICCQ